MHLVMVEQTHDSLQACLLAVRTECQHEGLLEFDRFHRHYSDCWWRKYPNGYSAHASQLARSCWSNVQPDMQVKAQ